MATKSQTGTQERVVLIVDDEEPNRQLLSALLSAQGYTAKIACDGPSALDQVKAGGIDLMLLDVMMPGMDGVEACQRIRKELGLSDLTIVFVTALSDRESRMRAKLAGADDFLVKPIDSFELTFRVANWMKLRTLRDFELCTSELEQRLNDAATRAGAAAHKLGELARGVDAQSSGTSTEADRTALAKHLAAQAAELRELSENALRPLEARIPNSTQPRGEARSAGRESGVEPHATPFFTRNQRT